MKNKSFFFGMILGSLGTSLLIFITAMIWSSNVKQSIPDPYFPGEFKLYKVSYYNPYTNSYE